MFKLASSIMFKAVNNHVQAGQLDHVQGCQQPCSSCPAQPCSRLSTKLFKLASSTMFKPVNNHVQACQQQSCSSWPAQPCSSLSTTIMFKLASSTMFKPVNRQIQTVRFYVCRLINWCLKPSPCGWILFVYKPIHSLRFNVIRDKIYFILEVFWFVFLSLSKQCKE